MGSRYVSLQLSNHVIGEIELILTCECEHTRKEHQAGKENYSDQGVRSCMVKDCKCKKYHANEDSRKIKSALYVKLGLYICIVGIVAAGTFYPLSIGLNFAIDDMFKQYDIKQKFSLYDKYVNGTEIKHVYPISGTSDYSPSAEVKDFVITIVGMVIFFSAFIICSILSMNYIETNWMRIIKE